MVLDVQPARFDEIAAHRWSRAFAKLRLAMRADEAIAMLDYDRHTIQLSVSSAIEYHTRLHACKKEPETVAWIEQAFRAGDVFYDVGANVGTYALVAAAYWGEAVRVVAIEPSAFNVARLMRNLSLNPCGRRVIAVPVALGQTTGVSTFHYATVMAGGSLHALGEARDYRAVPFEPAVSASTLAFDLDTLVAQFQLPPPTHLKLDVDGTELAILRGATRTLEHVRSVLVELEDDHPDAPEVRRLLEAHGLEEIGSYPYRFGARHPEFNGLANVVFHR
jgi:FkbM family methyltransferase